MIPVLAPLAGWMMLAYYTFKGVRFIYRQFANEWRRQARQERLNRTR